jgi:LysM repeat protein
MAKKFGEYQVRNGDTKYSIARTFGLSIDELQFANQQLKGDLIIPGQVLIIPSVD